MAGHPSREVPKGHLSERGSAMRGSSWLLEVIKLRRVRRLDVARNEEPRSIEFLGTGEVEVFVDGRAFDGEQFEADALIAA